MIRHVVLLNWNENTDETSILKVTEGFSVLAETIPEIKSYTFGADAGIYKGNADYGLVADFETEVDFTTYVTHPKHQAFMKNVTGPLIASFQSIQFVIG